CDYEHIHDVIADGTESNASQEAAKRQWDIYKLWKRYKKKGKKKLDQRKILSRYVKSNATAAEVDLSNQLHKIDLFVHYYKEHINLPQYLPAFIQNFCADLNMLECFDHKSLKDIGVLSTVHQKFIHNQFQKFILEHKEFKHWLKRELQLPQYIEQFENCGVFRFKDLQQLVTTTTDLRRVLQIRNRQHFHIIQRAIQQQFTGLSTIYQYSYLFFILCLAEMSQKKKKKNETIQITGKRNAVQQQSPIQPPMTAPRNTSEQIQQTRKENTMIDAKLQHCTKLNTEITTIMTQKKLVMAIGNIKIQNFKKKTQKIL
ncbi:hypothetical protein RFI_16520, partial [Reticulomyxa filosa]